MAMLQTWTRVSQFLGRLEALSTNLLQGSELSSKEKHAYQYGNQENNIVVLVI